MLTEKGTRTKERRPDERPSDVQVIKKFGDRTVVNVDNNIYVESSDRPRMSRGSKEVYYEDLPRSRTRETIVRDNGVQIVTIRNRYGDVIQRSRVMPDGREVVLTYTPDYDREERLQWRDPGDDLPPLELTIPVHDYIMDAEQAPEEDVYAFFEQPPVERVERIYSIDEVKRSARIRDKIRRVDLDTITFPFGSADIGEDQISHIESVAKAMAQILKKNPAETFLIEGHTDAVGSDQANLVLSDKRADIGSPSLDQRVRHPAGKHGYPRLWRALYEDQSRWPGTAEPPCRYPPHYAACCSIGEQLTPDTSSENPGFGPGFFYEYRLSSAS